MTTIKKHLLRGLSVLAAAVMLAASAGCNFNGEPGELPGKAAFTLEPMEDFPQDSTDGSEDNSSAELDSDGDSSDNNGGESSDNSDAVSFAGSTWSSGDTYTGGMEVQHEGKIYRALSGESQGDVPSASATDGPWEYVGEVSVTEPEPEETEPEIDDNTPDAPTKAGVEDFKIVGYYPSWEPDKVKYIQYDNLTHINYAFAIPQNDGTLLPLENPDAAKKIIKAAHKKGVKVLIAIGGWSYKEIPLEPNFVAATNSPEKIEKFAGEIMAMVDKYGFDGVDMDWEHPRRDGNSSQQYTQLMQTLSKQLHAKDKLLTSAVLSGVNADGGIYYDSSAHTDEVINAVDWFNVMAYDGGDGERHSSYDFAVNSANYWKNTRKMPANKVVLGVPFYGRPSWKTYAEILAANPEAYNTDISTINGIQAHYNGIPTITKKTQWACDNVGGIMIWEISQDSTDKKTSLLNAIHETAKENKKVD